MKRRILIFLLICSLCSLSQAQMYNYMGKHILFNAECSLSPSWINPNPMTPHLANLSVPAQRYLGINYWVTPSVELMVWEKGAVGMGYNFYNSLFKGKHAYYDSYYQSYAYREYEGTITAHGFNVFYKQYLGQTFAPLGHYLKFNFDGFFYEYTTNCVLQGKDMLFGMKVEYGYDFLLFDRLRLSIGASIGSTFNDFSLAFKQMVGEDNPIGHTASDYANARMWMAYWFGIKLGVGFLAF